MNAAVASMRNAKASCAQAIHATTARALTMKVSVMPALMAVERVSLSGIVVGSGQPTSVARQSGHR